MYPQSDVIKFGVAPNPLQNATLEEARRMGGHWACFVPIKALSIILTAPSGPVASQMAPAMEVAPPLDESSPAVLWVLNVIGEASDRPFDLWVSQWWRIVANEGLRVATQQYLDFLKPSWRSDPLIVRAVALLPGRPPMVVPGEPVLNIPLAPAEPDWALSIGAGWLAVRTGDVSLPGKAFESPTLGTWVKKVDPSMFNPLGGNARWERA